MTWEHPDAAPDGVIVRAAITHKSRGTYELPYELVRKRGRWFYARTMAPVFPWHVPVSWSIAPRLIEEQHAWEAAAAAVYGSRHLPSVRFAT